MNNPRRIFLSQISLMAGATALSRPLASAAAVTRRINTLYNSKNAVTVYHTNDVKGNIDAVFKQKGGLNLIKSELQKQEAGGLLLDAGNFINGTHGIYRQKQTIALMNNMGYHSAAVGGHELLSGQQHLSALVPSMRFPLLNCNYEFVGDLRNMIKPFTVITIGRFRVGITAVGSQVDGIKYNDAVTSANKAADLLKDKKKCDLVICLSHLPYALEGDAPDNNKLAYASENIDMIVGSNNDRLMINPMVLQNRQKHEVILTQTAWHGLMMGRTVINFDENRQKNGLDVQHIIPGTSPKLFAAAFADIALANPARV